MTSRDLAADRAESEMLDRAAEIRVHLHGEADCRIERRGELVMIRARFGETVLINEHYIRRAAAALGLEVRAPESVSRARGEAMGGKV